jgi:hypothetical protein
MAPPTKLISRSTSTVEYTAYAREQTFLANIIYLLCNLQGSHSRQRLPMSLTLCAAVGPSPSSRQSLGKKRLSRNPVMFLTDAGETEYMMSNRSLADIQRGIPIGAWETL